MSTLRIATLNVWNKSGPWPERLEMIRTELSRLQPGILGLQEVLRFAPNGLDAFDGRTEHCQALQIAQGFGYEAVFVEACDYSNGLRFGNALLTRWPIRESRSFMLPSLGSGESRALLYALVETPYGPLPTFVTHLNWKLHHGSVRLEQVRYIVERIFELAPVQGSLLPPLLMGDMNADPDSDEMRYLRGLKVLDGKSVYFTDAWLYAGDGSFGATFDRKNHFARRSHEPSRRIDYVFVRGPDKLLRGEPIRTELAFDRADTSGSIWPSDHFGLVTDLFFEPRSP
ncbi:MAG: endonuclease/exonuclease/phosphatase family protein [Myxococcota bacterium]|nr:endonuclease/exonuclease/phosphatase family protein [Myxococcota bacterium]